MSHLSVRLQQLGSQWTDYFNSQLTCMYSLLLQFMLMIQTCPSAVQFKTIFFISQIACALTSCLEWNLLLQTDSGTVYPTCSEVLTSQFYFLAEEL